jgi:hypothetical protein
LFRKMTQPLAVFGCHLPAGYEMTSPVCFMSIRKQQRQIERPYLQSMEKKMCVINQK